MGVTVIVMAVDPGTEQSAFVIWNGVEIFAHDIVPNDVMRAQYILGGKHIADVLTIEKIESFGMPVGKEVLRTVFWSGRFAEAWEPKRWEEVTRREVKIHICGHARANDANVRQALIDRFGPPGVKAMKGLLYKIKGHEYAALAVAVTFHDQHAHDGEMIRKGVLADF